MKTKTWCLIVLFSLITIGLILVLMGVYEMNRFEILDSHETVKDALRDARYATRGKWISGLVLMIGAYVLTYFPYKK